MTKSTHISPVGVPALIEAAEEAGEYFSDLFDELFSTTGDPAQAAEMNAVLTKLEKAAEQARGDDSLSLVATLPFVSRARSEHGQAGEEPTYDIVIWHSVTNICEELEAGHGRCDTGAGLYYGTSDSREGKFCPRHYYEMHFDQEASYQLLDQTIEEYIAALDAKETAESK